MYFALTVLELMGITIFNCSSIHQRRNHDHFGAPDDAVSYIIEAVSVNAKVRDKD